MTEKNIYDGIPEGFYEPTTFFKFIHYLGADSSLERADLIQYMAQNNFISFFHNENVTIRYAEGTQHEESPPVAFVDLWGSEEGIAQVEKIIAEGKERHDNLVDETQRLEKKVQDGNY